MVLFGECGWFFEEACCHGLEGGLLFQPWFCLEDCCLKNASLLLLVYEMILARFSLPHPPAAKSFPFPFRLLQKEAVDTTLNDYGGRLLAFNGISLVSDTNAVTGWRMRGAADRRTLVYVFQHHEHLVLRFLSKIFVSRATFSLLTTLKGNCSKFMGNFLSAVNCFPAVVEDLKHFRSICCLESWCSCGCVVVMLNMFKASRAMVFVKDFRFAWRSSWPGLAEEIC
ncbi:hypothetical protein U1Q18_049670 [Sarracenia purpurea var. burkii]